MRFTPKQKYIRIFLSLSMFLCLIVTPFTFFLSTQFSKYADAEINNITSDKLNQTLENTKFTLNKIRNYGLSIYNDQNIHNWLVSESNDPFSSMVALNSMGNLLSNEPFIFKSYLINLNEKNVIDSQTGLQSFATFNDPDMLQIVMNNRPNFLRYFNHSVNNRSYMSLVIPSTPTNNDYNGYLVLLLDNNLLQNYLLQFNKDVGINVIILDQQGDRIIGATNDESAPSSLMSLKKNETGLFNVTINREKWSVNYVDVEPEPWTIYYMTKLDQLKSKVSSFQNNIILSSFLMLFALLILIFWSSHRSYRPFSQLAEMMQEKISMKLGTTTSGSPKNAEYTVIKQGMDLLLNNLDNMVFSLRNHQELINSEYLRQWILLGKMNQSIKEYVQTQLDLTYYSYLHLVVVRIDNYSSFTEKYNNFGSRKLLKYAMGNIAKEIIQSRKWAAESVDFGGDHIVVLTGTNDEGSSYMLADILHETSIQIEKWLSIQVVIGMSQSFDKHDDIRAMYDHAYEMTQLKFITGINKIYQEKDYAEYMALIKPLQDETLLESLIQSVRLGQTDKMKTLLDLLMAQMQNLSYAECKFQLTLIIHSIMKSFKQFSFIKTTDGIQSFLESFSTLMEIGSWLYNSLEDIIVNMRQRKNSSRTDDLALEIVEYLKNRIHDPLLSVEEISDHLSLSVSYIRQVFKEAYGITLADFILEARIENVKKLLESTNWTIADIAGSSGFQTKSHFHTAFKKTTGMTPNEYRRDRHALNNSTTR